MGIATYNVVPNKAGLYFIKHECFCFDEQLLPARSSVELPVLFRIDPEFADDHNMYDVNSITLNYTFFRSRDFDAMSEEERKRYEKL